MTQGCVCLAWVEIRDGLDLTNIQNLRVFFQKLLVEIQGGVTEGLLNRRLIIVPSAFIALML